MLPPLMLLSRRQRLLFTMRHAVFAAYALDSVALRATNESTPSHAYLRAFDAMLSFAVYGAA